MGKKPITWLCSPWRTSACVPIEGEVTKWNAKRKNKKKQNLFLLQVDFHVYVLFLLICFILKQLVFPFCSVFINKTTIKNIVGNYTKLDFVKVVLNNGPIFMDDPCPVNYIENVSFPLFSHLPDICPELAIPLVFQFWEWHHFDPWLVLCIFHLFWLTAHL